MSAALDLVESSGVKDEMFEVSDEIVWDAQNYQDRLPGFKREKSEARKHNFSIRYGYWLFVVSTYLGGETIWNAFYRIPGDAPSHWACSPQPIELPPGSNLTHYYRLLKEMADKNPNPWGSGIVYPMPYASQCAGC